VRTVVLCCKACGLHFTVTWHQLARAYQQQHSGSADEPDELGLWLQQMAEGAAETRGRRPFSASAAPVSRPSRGA
jgi:hypothetical protein